MAGRRIVVTVAAAGLAGGVVLGAAALTVSGMLGGFVAAPASAQAPPPGTEGSAPGLGGDTKGTGAGPEGVGPKGAGMPPGGAVPPDKRGAPATVAGSYALVGRNPNGSSYTGRVTVTPTGETFKVVWRVGSQTFVGTGIQTGSILSVAYNGGLAVYWFSSQGIKGRWTTTNATSIATEDWTRQ